jgi:hypothetical protein
VTDRLPARIEVSALLRQVQAEGGFGMIIARGDPDAGALMVVLCDRGADYRAYERMPSLEGGESGNAQRGTTPNRPMSSPIG